uniref:Placenta associated 8 A n=1 Tax=Equus caballus TaxID=9796 RepID=A0A3Q2HUQ3_HORSE
MKMKPPRQKSLAWHLTHRRHSTAVYQRSETQQLSRAAGSVSLIQSSWAAGFLGGSPTVCSALLNLALKMNPVVAQPGYGARGATASSWQTDVFDCCDDLGVCLCGTFFPLCLSCQIASDMDECCLCGGSVAMRTLYRTRYGIPGSICDDYLCLMCCPNCTLCQLKRDIDKRRAMNAF